MSVSSRELPRTEGLENQSSESSHEEGTGGFEEHQRTEPIGATTTKGSLSTEKARNGPAIEMT